MGLRQIPSLWVGVHDTVENLVKNMRAPVLHIEEFQAEVNTIICAFHIITSLCTTWNFALQIYNLAYIALAMLYCIDNTCIAQR